MRPSESVATRWSRRRLMGAGDGGGAGARRDGDGRLDALASGHPCGNAGGPPQLGRGAAVQESRPGHGRLLQRRHHAGRRRPSGRAARSAGDRGRFGAEVSRSDEERDRDRPRARRGRGARWQRPPRAGSRADRQSARGRGDRRAVVVGDVRARAEGSARDAVGGVVSHRAGAQRRAVGGRPRSPERAARPRFRGVQPLSEGTPRLGPADGGGPQSQRAVPSAGDRARSVVRARLRGTGRCVYVAGVVWIAAARGSLRAGGGGRRQGRRARWDARRGARLAGRGAEEPLRMAGGRTQLHARDPVEAWSRAGAPLVLDLPGAARAVPRRRSPRFARRSRSIRCRSARTCSWAASC